MVFPDEPGLADAGTRTMLGPDVLLVPVLSSGADSVEAVLPPGRWTHVSTGGEHGAPSEVTRVDLPAPLGKPALLVRSGSEVAAELAEFTGR